MLWMRVGYLAAVVTEDRGPGGSLAPVVTEDRGSGGRGTQVLGGWSVGVDVGVPTVLDCILNVIVWVSLGLLVIGSGWSLEDE